MPYGFTKNRARSRIAEFTALDDYAFLVHHGPVAHSLMDIPSDTHQIVFSFLSLYGLAYYLKERRTQTNPLSFILLKKC